MLCNSANDLRTRTSEISVSIFNSALQEPVLHTHRSAHTHMYAHFEFSNATLEFCVKKRFTTFRFFSFSHYLLFSNFFFLSLASNIFPVLMRHTCYTCDLGGLMHVLRLFRGLVILSLQAWQ